MWGQERRHNERRAADRGAWDRRRSVRRRALLRRVIFAAMAVSVPHQLAHAHVKWPSASHAPEPRVTAAIDEATAIPPSRRFDGLIHEAAARYRVSPALIRSVMQAESAFDPIAVSSAGAMGLMQLMPDVASAFGIADPFDPRENIMGGARLLRELLDSHHRSIPLVLAAYNAGPTALACLANPVPLRRNTRRGCSQRHRRVRASSCMLP